MQALQNLVESGRIVDIMLVLVALEVTVLLLVRRRHGAPLAPLLANTGAGVSLILALRFALTDANWLLISACLLAALVFHVADVTLRRERSAGDGRAGP